MARPGHQPALLAALSPPLARVEYLMWRSKHARAHLAHGPIPHPSPLTAPNRRRRNRQDRQSPESPGTAQYTEAVITSSTAVSRYRSPPTGSADRVCHRINPAGAASATSGLAAVRLRNKGYLRPTGSSAKRAAHGPSAAQCGDHVHDCDHLRAGLDREVWAVVTPPVPASLRVERDHAGDRLRVQDHQVVGIGIGVQVGPLVPSRKTYGPGPPL